jgi:hypothetical protein
MSYSSYSSSASAEKRTIPMIPSAYFYSSLRGYSENGKFGFMKFNPPVSDPSFYPYMRKFDPEIKYQPDYNTLLHPGTDKYPNTNVFFASITNAYRE